MTEIIHSQEGIGDIDMLHEIGSCMAASNSFHEVLSRIIDMVTAAVRCDSCFIYVLEKDKLVLRASKNPHIDVVDKLEMNIGEGVTGWVAEYRQTVSLPARAWTDARFTRFVNLPEDRYEAFLSVPILSRGKIVGVINVQHRDPHHHTKREIRLITMIGYLVGAEIELARMELETVQAAGQLENRKSWSAPKACCSANSGSTRKRPISCFRNRVVKNANRCAKSRKQSFCWRI